MVLMGPFNLHYSMILCIVGICCGKKEKSTPSYLSHIYFLQAHEHDTGLHCGGEPWLLQSFSVGKCPSVGISHQQQNEPLTLQNSVSWCCPVCTLHCKNKALRVLQSLHSSAWHGKGMTQGGPWGETSKSCWPDSSACLPSSVAVLWAPHCPSRPAPDYPAWALYSSTGEAQGTCHHLCHSWKLRSLASTCLPQEVIAVDVTASATMPRISPVHSIFWQSNGQILATGLRGAASLLKSNGKNKAQAL